MMSAIFRVNAVFLVLLIVILGMPVCAGDDFKLEIVYPKDNAAINAYSTFFVGNTYSGARLTINNKRVKVYENGGFVHVVQLKPGENKVKITSDFENTSKTLEYTVSTPEDLTTIPHHPLLISTSSVTPKKSMVYKTGDTLYISFRGSTGNKAYFSIGKQRKNIPLFEQPPGYIKTAPVYGKSPFRSAAPVKGIYKGSYRIQDRDKFNNERIIITLVSPKDRINYELPAKISTITPESSQMTAVVTTDYAIVRTYPGKSRLTPLPKDTFLHLTGKIGDQFRFKMGENQEGWISEEDVTLMPNGARVPEVSVQLIDIVSSKEDVNFRIPIAQKQPFIIEQPSENELYLKLFGVKADIDLFSYENQDEFIKEVKWTQDSKNSVKINIKANAKQLWGYKYYYEDDTLVLKLRKPPLINPDKPLKGMTICLDPGHGGEEDGAIGPTAVPEKQVNLEISLKLKDMLEKKGANVIMTRTTDEKIDLYDRVKTANKNNALILLSIHNNSLPDGRNPYTEHGTSTYYYHSQSLPLAKILHKALLEDVKFKDFGLFWSSFALTRTHEPLAVLLEIGFMINPDEYNLITEEEFQEKIAKSITRGLSYFFFVNAVE